MIHVHYLVIQEQSLQLGLSDGLYILRSQLRVLLSGLFTPLLGRLDLYQ